MAVQVTLIDVAAMATVPSSTAPVRKITLVTLRKRAASLGKYRLRVQVRNSNGSVGHKRAEVGPNDEPDVFIDAAEIGAVERRRKSVKVVAAVIEDTGASIDDLFRIVNPCLNRRGACKRGRCDDPLTGLHD